MKKILFLFLLPVVFSICYNISSVMFSSDIDPEVVEIKGNIIYLYKNIPVKMQITIDATNCENSSIEELKIVLSGREVYSEKIKISEGSTITRTAEIVIPEDLVGNQTIKVYLGKLNISIPIFIRDKKYLLKINSVSDKNEVKEGESVEGKITIINFENRPLRVKIFANDNLVRSELVIIKKNIKFRYIPKYGTNYIKICVEDDCKTYSTFIIVLKSEANKTQIGENITAEKGEKVEAIKRINPYILVVVAIAVVALALKVIL